MAPNYLLFRSDDTDELLGDGFCDYDLLNNHRCCFDNGDCNHVNSSMLCPPCGNPAGKEDIGNGICNSQLFSLVCCFDLGDCGCPGMSVLKIECCHPKVLFWNKGCPLKHSEFNIDNDVCDTDLAVLPECCLDGGDCTCLFVNKEVAFI